MQHVRMAAFISGASLYLVLPSSLHSKRPLHRLHWIFSIGLAGRHRECPMAGTTTPVFRCEGSLPSSEIYTRYCICPARARRGRSERSNTCAAVPFLGGVWTCPGRHQKFAAHTTALDSPPYVDMGQDVRVESMIDNCSVHSIPIFGVIYSLPSYYHSLLFFRLTSNDISYSRSLIIPHVAVNGCNSTIVLELASLHTCIVAAAFVLSYIPAGRSCTWLIWDGRPCAGKD